MVLRTVGSERTDCYPSNMAGTLLASFRGTRLWREAPLEEKLFFNCPPRINCSKGFDITEMVLFYLLQVKDRINM